MKRRKKIDKQRKVLNMIKYPVYKPFLNGNEKKYVDECLDTTWISSKGHFVEDFEKSFSSYIGMNHGAAVCNGTAAIQVAIKALDIKPGDEVICPVFTYIASVNPVTEAGATPILVDCLKDSWQMNPEEIKRKITNKTKAIIAVHLYGQPCNIEEIKSIAIDNNLYLIEDCAEAIGSKYNNKRVGSFGDISCFSFFGNKTITCGEGGMVLTNDDLLYKKILYTKNQGNDFNKEYWHNQIGFNYRMTNIQAAIGLAQFENIDKFIEKKRQIAKWYQECLNKLPIVFHKECKQSYHTYWMNTILTRTPEERIALRDFLKSNGIETRPTFYPINRFPMYLSDEKYPIAEEITYRGINLPSYPQLEKDDIVNICNCISDFYSK